MTSTRPVPPGKVAVVVATHAYCFPLDKCLTDFAALVENPRDVIFVDNGSGGELTRWAEAHLPQVTILTREVNGFFCGGYNEGIRYAVDRGYEHVLIANADTEVCNREFLNVMLDVAKRHPRAAFIGPKVYLREVGNVQNTVLTFPSSWRNLRSFVGVKFFGSRPPASSDQEKEVEFLNGVCVLCRVEALREIGPLDENMGGYVEDTDWAWRARGLAWTSVYTPVASIVHHQTEAGYEHYSLKSFMLRRNQIFWHWKTGHRFRGSTVRTLCRAVGQVTRRSRNPEQGSRSRGLHPLQCAIEERRQIDSRGASRSASGLGPRSGRIEYRSFMFDIATVVDVQACSTCGGRRLSKELEKGFLDAPEMPDLRSGVHFAQAA